MSSILVVDDDRTTRHVLSKVLTGAGFKTSVARDGVEALKALRARQFDVLLLDVWMPRMNGLDLLSKLRNDKTRPRVVTRRSPPGRRRVASAAIQRRARSSLKCENTEKA